MALLSPAASNYLEPLGQRAQRPHPQRFGNTVGFTLRCISPNLCANDCTYCGFSMSTALSARRWIAAGLPAIVAPHPQPGL
ncbi:hypothetical protein LAD77_01535 [Klebsiella pneumoniae]|nr:hypothetical protein [Klebsiella pneumoniae]